MDELLMESKRIKAQADKILKESKIVEILGKYGEVKIAGSYALDVMLRPDLDIYLIVKKHDWNKVFSIQSEIVRSRYFRQILLSNWIEFEKKPVGSHQLLGYYIMARVPIRDQDWKVDIWIITPKYDKSEKLTEHFKKLLEKADESKKIAILEIKNAMIDGKKYIKGVDGKLIYKAVLEKGITNPEDFKEFLLKQKK